MTNISNVTKIPEEYLYSHPNRQDSDPLYIAIPLTLLYSFILITGILGNVITCVVILRNKYLHTATNYYLFSLAVSDLLLLIFGLPLEIYYIWRRYPYIFGETFCLLRGLMAETSTNASVLTITAFTVERYVAICHPFLAHTISNLSRAVKLVIAIWIISLICAIPQALQFGIESNEGPEFQQCTITQILIPYSFDISTLIFFFIPMVAITILYIRIGLKLRNSAKMNERRASRPMLSSEHQQNSSQRLIAVGQPSRKILKMLVAVVITFFICWAPFHTQRLVAMHMEPIYDSESSLAVKMYDIVTYISAILYYLSTTVNPILYHTMSHKFRDAFKDTVNDVCCRNGRLEDGDNYYRSRRRRSSQLYHSVYKLRHASSDGSSVVEYNPTNQAKIICREIISEVNSNCNSESRDLSKSVMSGSNYKSKQIVPFLKYPYRGLNRNEDKKNFLWHSNNNNNFSRSINKDTIMMSNNKKYLDLTSV